MRVDLVDLTLNRRETVHHVSFIRWCAPCANCGDIVSGESQALACGEGGFTTPALTSQSRHTKYTVSLKGNSPGFAPAALKSLHSSLDELTLENHALKLELAQLRSLDNLVTNLYHEMSRLSGDTAFLTRPDSATLNPATSRLHRPTNRPTNRVRPIHVILRRCTCPRAHAAMPRSHVNSAVHSGDSYKTENANNGKAKSRDTHTTNCKAEMRDQQTSSYLRFFVGVTTVLGFYIRQFFSPVTSHKPFFILFYISTTRVHCILDTYCIRVCIDPTLSLKHAAPHRAMLQHSSPRAMVITCLVLDVETCRKTLMKIDSHLV